MQHILCVCKSCSLSLYLGNEIFDVHVMQLQGDFNHLFVRQGTGLQGQSVFKTKLTFRFVSVCLFSKHGYNMCQQSCKPGYCFQSCSSGWVSAH